VLEACCAGGLVRADLDLDDGAERLHVLVDGLALHLLGPQQRLPAARSTALLEEHLIRLTPVT
jgi:hypothetical protein